MKYKTYMCYIKSHCEYPDIEIEVRARTKRQALRKLLKRESNLAEFAMVDLAPYVGELDQDPDAPF